MNEIATLALYRDVRLLYGLPYFLLFDKENLEGAHTRALWTAQDSFIRHIKSHPEIGHHVQHLEWEQNSNDRSTGDIFTDIFPLMPNVRKIRLVSAYSFHIGDISLQMAPIFPGIEDITLAGLTAPNFAMATLHSPNNIQALCLDSINPFSTYVQLLEWLSVTELPNLERLTLRALCTQVMANGDLPFLWRKSLLATKKTVRELTLEVSEQKNCPSDHQQYQSAQTKLIDTLLPFFQDNHVTKGVLQGLHLSGFILDKNVVHSLRSMIPSFQVME